MECCGLDALTCSRLAGRPWLESISIAVVGWEQLTGHACCKSRLVACPVVGMGVLVHLPIVASISSLTLDLYTVV